MGVNLLTGSPTEVPTGGVNLLADEPEKEAQEVSAGGFSAGFKSVTSDDSLILKGGGLLAEAVSDPELVEANRNAKKFEKWQPQIWDAEDRLNSIQNRNSKEYQDAWENLRNIKRSFTDDMNGVAPEGEDFDFGEFIGSLKNNTGFVLGSMAKSMLMDPELMLVPGGWIKAGNTAVRATKNATAATKAASKIAAQSAGGAGVGIPLGVAGEVIFQLDENPDAPIDFERVKNTGLFTGVASAVLPPIGAAAKAITKVPMTKISEVMDANKISKIQKDAQKIYIEALNEEGTPGLNRQAAVNKAVAKNDPSGKLDDHLPDMDIYMSDAAIATRTATEAQKGVVGQSIDIAGKGLQNVKDFGNWLTQPITSALRQMGLPNVARTLNEHDMNVGTDIQRKQEIAAVFSREYGKLDSNEQAFVARELDNGTYAAVRDRFSNELNESIDNVRKMLDDEFISMEESGMKVGRTENYFPREMDYDAFIRSKGVEPAAINKDLADFVNNKLNLQGKDKLKASDMNQDMIRKHLKEEDVAQILNKRITKTQGNVTLVSSTSELKSRTVADVSPENLQFYADPRAALHNHINRVTPKIHDRRFFGGKKIDKDIEALGGRPDDESLISAYIRDHSARLAANGDILPGDMAKVEKLLHARFVGSKRRAHSVVNGTKNLLYAATLGNPLAASTQLGDLGGAAYMNGWTRSINNIIGESIEGTRFKMKDFGLESIPELESMGVTRKILDWSLKLGGFRAMDRLGKETILNSTYSKLRTEVAKDAPGQTSAKTFKYFKNRYGKRLGDDEVQKIIDGVKTGDPTNPDARLAMYSDLTRVQPISMSEMPVAYLNHPNARIFFMLKTFTLKQIDLMRNEVINEIRTGVKKGNKKQIAGGVLNLGKIAGTIGLANMGVDYTKRWLSGRETDLTDVMVDTALRNYGLSSYTLSEITRGDLEGAITKLAFPPLSVIENPAKAAFGIDTKGRWIDTIPVVGRTIRTAKEIADEHF